MTTLFFIAVFIAFIIILPMAIARLDFLFGTPPPARVKKAKHDDLYEASLNRAVTAIGEPSSGKTRWVAFQVFKKFKKYPKHAIFVFDPSGVFCKIK